MLEYDIRTEKEKVKENTFSKGNNEVNNVEIIYDIANLNDIPELVRLRILYMIDDFGLYNR